MRPGRRIFAITSLAGVCGAGALGCSDDDRGAERFCGELAEVLATLDGPVAAQADVDAIVATYEHLDGITPLAVEREWHQLTELVQTAATVLPDDPASVQRVADAAYAAERSARSVNSWVATTCGLEMPAVIGIEGPMPPVATQPTTTPPTTSPPPESPPPTETTPPTEG